MNRHLLLLTVLSLLLFFLLGCHDNSISEKEIDLSAYQIETGYRLDLVASEPLLMAPVAMDFDQQGRIWVLELPGYMANLDGKGEQDPSGRILILTDRNQNGRMDQAITFLDSLVAPRALLLVYGGLLYAEPPNLWFVDIVKDKPANKILVDSAYVQVGNIEHQANSLLMNIDNWIYSARSNARYQRKNGRWIKEQTIYRGQWGLTKDAQGRLFYNDNSNQFQGDFVLPKTAEQHPYLRPKHSVRQQIVHDQRMYALHAAPINRGYLKGNLDEQGKPLKATSSCGPLIYQGDLLGDTFYQQSFVCFPEGNIVKRNKLQYEGEKITGMQALEGSEFIAATDIAFRPVNLYNGPDGALYILDLHKGVIQHRAYLSPYLRKKIEELQLDTIVGMGRILRVSPEAILNTPVPSFDTKQLSTVINELRNRNVWQRDRAQQHIVQHQLKTAIPLLENILRREDYDIDQVHALWTLEGLDALSFDLLKLLIIRRDTMLSPLAFHLLSRLDNSVYNNDIALLANHLFDWNQPAADLYLAANIGLLLPRETALSFYEKLEKRYPDNKVFAELSFSCLSAQEEAFIGRIAQKDSSTWMRIGYELLTNIAKDQKNEELLPAINNPYGDKRQKGLDLYQQYCAVCHAEDGKGIENGAPPLYESDFVIHLQGKKYEFNAVMPGLANNPDLTDQDILSIIEFIRNAFITESDFNLDGLTEERLQELRKLPAPGGGLYTVEDLERVFK
jgi:putative membrane-bound dehydrogenase-like protein